MLKDLALQSQINSVRQLAVILCPTYYENNLHWKNILMLMEQHSQLVKKMPTLAEENEKEETKLITNNSIQSHSPSSQKRTRVDETEIDKVDKVDKSSYE